MVDAQATGEAVDPYKDKRAAATWLHMLEEAKRLDQKYQDKCDSIDKLYADLDALAKESTERQFQIFWANLEVLKPSIYSRPPVPVVVPRFKDRKELPRMASEMLERSLVSSFEADDIDATMRLCRDDLATNARGVIWCRYEANRQTGEQKVHKEHLERKDFRHGPARKWAEVPWVARRTWMVKAKGEARFGDIFKKAEFKKRDENSDEYEGEKEAEVWELWHKEHGCVVWVSPGMEDVLDIRNAKDVLDLEGFFPCPRPAYGTVKRGTLTPVPDFLYYKDQVEEINELTARISALSEQLRLKGFYPSGASEVGEAVEAVLKDQDNNAVLVPIANLALFGSSGGGLKDAVVWIPIRDVAEVIRQLIELRRQLIEDVYQITGISDIMRGSTDPNETKGAQVLKSQYGSVRVRDRQNEMVRVARDVTRIEAEIMAENFTPETLVNMSQMTDIPTDAAIGQQIQQITQQVQQAVADPTMLQKAKENPEEAKKMLEAAKAQVDQLQAKVTLEKIVALLREQRVRPFVLEIETDSTIQPDEDAAKQRASEMVTAVGGYMAQAFPLVQALPEAAPMAAEFLKYIASQFRAGRQLDGVIDEFADKMKSVSQQPKPPNPEAVKAEMAQKQAEQDANTRQQESAARIQEINVMAPVKQAEADARLREIGAKANADAADANAQVTLNNQKIRLGELSIELAEVNLKNAQAKPQQAAA